MSDKQDNDYNKILIAEDNQNLNKLINRKLKRLGYQVTQVFSAEEVIVQLKGKGYDLLLLDFDLADSNAKQLIAKLDDIPPFIIMTGNGDEEVAVEMMKLGAEDYMVKDAHFIELLPEVINKTIQKLNKEQKLEEAYQKIGKYYKSLFTDNPKVLLLIDPQTGVIFDANQAAAEFYGYGVDRLVGRKISSINSSEQKLIDNIEDIRKDRRNYFESTHQLADGQHRNVRMHGEIIVVHEQELLYLIITDVTEHKKVKNKLETQEEKYKLLFQNTGTATAIVEEDMTISLVNEEVEALLGYSKEELEEEKNWAQFIAFEEELENLLIYNQQRIRGEAPEKYECHIQNKDEEIKNVLIKIKMIPETKQRIVSLLDITKRKEKEEELNRAYKRLNHNIDKARQLHQHFLPRPFSEFDNMAIAVYYKPAEKLGGDFYNFQNVNDQLVFYVADVSGHGLDGAMLNLLIREQISNFISNSRINRNLVSEAALEPLLPKEMMEMVSKNYLEQNFPEDYFLCIQIGVLDLNQKKLTYSNAGFHILPFIVSSSGEIDTLNNSHFPISSVREDDVDFEEIDYQLSCGDKLFITTDGLIEETVDEEMYGQNRLQEILEQYYYLPVEFLMEEVKQDFIEFAGDLNTKDDITLLALERKSNRKIVEKIASDFEQMSQLETEVINFLDGYVSEIDNIQMGLHEILTNAIEHGNQLDKSKQVEVKVNLFDDYIRIVVADEGEGFDWKEKLNVDLEDLGFAERGRGIIVAEQIFAKIKYNELGNQVCLIQFRE
ncbi:MAG: SpoIIE family protein phosphatase [Bacillota bacterium]